MLEEKIKEIMLRRDINAIDIYKPLKINRINFYKALKTSNLNNKTLRKIVNFLGYELLVDLKGKYESKSKPLSKNIRRK